MGEGIMRIWNDLTIDEQRVLMAADNVEEYTGGGAWIKRNPTLPFNGNIHYRVVPSTYEVDWKIKWDGPDAVAIRTDGAWVKIVNIAYHKRFRGYVFPDGTVGWVWMPTAVAVRMEEST